jgi:hypothetical protein
VLDVIRRAAAAETNPWPKRITISENIKVESQQGPVCDTGVPVILFPRCLSFQSPLQCSI